MLPEVSCGRTTPLIPFGILIFKKTFWKESVQFQILQELWVTYKCYKQEANVYSANINIQTLMKKPIPCVELELSEMNI